MVFMVRCMKRRFLLSDLSRMRPLCRLLGTGPHHHVLVLWLASLSDHSLSRGDDGRAKTLCEGARRCLGISVLCNCRGTGRPLKRMGRCCPPPRLLFRCLSHSEWQPVRGVDVCAVTVAAKSTGRCFSSVILLSCKEHHEARCP